MPEIEPEPAEVAEVTRHLLDALGVIEAHVPPSREAIRQMRAGLRRLGRTAGRMLAENRRMRRVIEDAEYRAAGYAPVVDDATNQTVGWLPAKLPVPESWGHDPPESSRGARPSRAREIFDARRAAGIPIGGPKLPRKAPASTQVEATSTAVDPE